MSLTPKKKAAYAQVVSEMLSHSGRCQYLRSHGFTIDVGCVIPDMGQVLWIERGPTTAWLSVKDGFVRIHGPCGEDLTWPEVIDWLNPKPAEPEKPKPIQRSMFDE